MQHTVQVTLEDALIHERDPAELQQGMKEGLILLDYVSAKISIGRFAELMEMSYVQARDWLHSRGIATLRRLKEPNPEAACEANFRDVARRGGGRSATRHGLGRSARALP